MLSSRSPVFRAMFQNNMEEANSKKVEIEVSFTHTWCVQQNEMAASGGKNVPEMCPFILVFASCNIDLVAIQALF